MGIQLLSERNVAKINRDHGTDFVKAAAWSSGLIEGVTAADVHWYLDRRTGTTERTAQGHWSSCEAKSQAPDD